MVIYDGRQWGDVSPSLLQAASLIGLGMQVDAAASFAEKLNATLWRALCSANGGVGSLMPTINKENAGSDVGLALQGNFETRALVGLFSDNDQACFDAVANLFTASVDGTYPLGAQLTYKTNGNAGAWMQGCPAVGGSTALPRTTS